MEKKLGVAIAVGFVILILMNNSLHRRIDNLESQVNTMAANQAHHTNQLHWAISDGINTLREQMYAAARTSFGETVRILRFDPADFSAEVEISFGLREFSPGGAVYVIAAGIDGSTVQAQAEQRGGRFAASLAMPLAQHMSVSYMTSGAAVTQGHLLDITLADTLSERFRYAVDMGALRRTHGVTDAAISPHFANDTGGNADLLINSIVIIFEAAGREVHRIDLMPYLRMDGHVQFFPTSREALIDGGGDFALPADFAAEGNTARLVMYDNLGIRYEQADRLFYPWGPPAVAFDNHAVIWSHGPGDVGWHDAPGGRVLVPGMLQSWGFIHIVQP